MWPRNRIVLISHNAAVPMSKEKSDNNEDSDVLNNASNEIPSKRNASLIEALSRAKHVAGNICFDHNNSVESHPYGSILRTQIKERWNGLILATASRLSSTLDKANVGDQLPASEKTSSWFQNIYDRHTEKGRHYHTIVHLWEMFELLDIVIEIMGSSNWYVPMSWSIFFHDSIYDCKSSQNEKDSAELFRAFKDACMTTTMDKVTFDIVLTMILATEKHKVILPIQGSSTALNQDQQEEIAMQEFFLDIDMAVLGKHRDAYFKYAALIRKEYDFVPHDVYCSKRADILETFLIGNKNTVDKGNINQTRPKKHIYLTKSFRAAFDNRARENLRDEIDLLRKNSIPT